MTMRTCFSECHEVVLAQHILISRHFVWFFISMKKIQIYTTQQGSYRRQIQEFLKEGGGE